MSGRGSGAFVLCPALELPELVLAGHLPLGRPPLHVAVLQDELPHLFQDDYVGAEEEEAEARGEHTVQEKYGPQRKPQTKMKSHNVNWKEISANDGTKA